MQRLMGASLLVFANKTDIEGSMSDNEIREVRVVWGADPPLKAAANIWVVAAASFGCDQNT